MQTLNIVAGVLFLMWGLGIVSHDMNTMKIPNARIIKGIKLTLLFLALHLGLSICVKYSLLMPWLSDANAYAFHFYPAYIIHTLLICVFGIIMWNTGVWPAGDAKFFMVLGAAIPLINPNMGGFPYKTFFFFLVNIFVSSAFWAFGTFFISGMQKMESKAFFYEVYSNFLREIQSFRQKYKPWQVLFILSGILVLFLIQRTISLTVRLTVAKSVTDPSVLFFVIFLIWDRLAPIFQKKAWVIFSGIAYALFIGLGIAFFPDRMIELLETAFLDMLKVSIFIMLVRRFAVFLMEQADMQLIYPEQLKPGMILSEKSRSLVIGDPNFEEDYDVFIKEGITPLQVYVLQGKAEMIRKKVPDFKIEVIKGRPFAGWVLLGAALTVLFRNNIAIMLFR